MAEWSTNDLRTSALSNQKNVLVQAAAPGTAYDGQVWSCTSSDPPLVKVYDDTNSQWMEYHPVYYETQTGAWANPAVTPVTNGTLVVLYNSTQAGTRLYGYSNAAWVNLGGTLAQVYPAGDQEADGTVAAGAQAITAANRIRSHSGLVTTVKTINITPTTSGATVVGFAGATSALQVGTDAGTFKLSIGGTEVDSEAVAAAAEVVSLRGFRDGMEDTSTAITLTFTKDADDSGVSGHTVDIVGVCVAGVTVET